MTPLFERCLLVLAEGGMRVAGGSMTRSRGAAGVGGVKRHGLLIASGGMRLCVRGKLHGRSLLRRLTRRLRDNTGSLMLESVKLSAARSRRGVLSRRGHGAYVPPDTLPITIFGLASNRD